MSVSLVTERTGSAAYGPHRSGPLELAGLRRRYGRTIALDGLSLAIEPGRIFGFLGPNGAGKLVVEVEGIGSHWYAGLPAAAVERIDPSRVRSTFDVADPRIVLDSGGVWGDSAVRPRGAVLVGVVPQGGGPMSVASTVRLVAGGEVRERGRSRAFWIGTSILLLGGVAAIALPAMLGRNGNRTFQVGAVGAAPGGLASLVISAAAARSPSCSSRRTASCGWPREPTPEASCDSAAG